MPRRPNARKVRTHAVYTVQELAEAIDMHPMTVRRWIREDGLPAVTDRKPWLIDGRDAKLFLEDRARAVKRPLKRDEFYCLRCRDRRRPDGGLVDYLPRTPEVGRLVGLCPSCGTGMHRVMRRADLGQLPRNIEVAFPMAVTRIQLTSSRVHARSSPSSGLASIGRNGTASHYFACQLRGSV